MSEKGEALAQLERLIATGLLGEFGTHLTANEVHEACGRIVPRAIAAMSWREREALAQLLQQTVNRDAARLLAASEF